MDENERNKPIAIVGAACRFAGGSVDLNTYWDLLRHGVDAVGECRAIEVHVVALLLPA